MCKGMILHNGAEVGTIEKTEDYNRQVMTQYVFTYVPSYTGSFLIDDLPIRDEPYCQEDLPDIIYDHIESVDKKEIKNIERYVLVSEELHLWLLCCENGLISAQDGYAIEED